jgi:hypothetical protein
MKRFRPGDGRGSIPERHRSVNVQACIPRRTHFGCNYSVVYLFARLSKTKKFVELIGFEPTTPGLQSRCSPS